jgi:hypothetical protein
VAAQEQQQKYFCPTCGLPTSKEIGESTEMEVMISYKQPGKDTYGRGWYGCLNCLKGLVKCVEEYMQVQRVNRGRSLRANREQYQKSKENGCGCGG